VADVTSLVETLFARLGDVTEVGAYLRADTSMNDRRREIALQLVLAKAVESSQRDSELSSVGAALWGGQARDRTDTGDHQRPTPIVLAALWGAT
jgi:hypothetical protein